MIYTYLTEAVDALEESAGLLKRLDGLVGLNEAQERILVSLSYEYDKLCEEINRIEEENTDEA